MNFQYKLTITKSRENFHSLLFNIKYFHHDWYVFWFNWQVKALTHFPLKGGCTRFEVEHISCNLLLYKNMYILLSKIPKKLKILLKQWKTALISLWRLPPRIAYPTLTADGLRIFWSYIWRLFQKWSLFSIKNPIFPAWRICALKFGTSQYIWHIFLINSYQYPKFCLHFITKIRCFWYDWIKLDLCAKIWKQAVYLEHFPN